MGMEIVEWVVFANTKDWLIRSTRFAAILVQELQNRISYKYRW